MRPSLAILKLDFAHGALSTHAASALILRAEDVDHKDILELALRHPMSFYRSCLWDDRVAEALQTP